MMGLLRDKTMKGKLEKNEIKIVDILFLRFLYQSVLLTDLDYGERFSLIQDFENPVNEVRLTTTRECQLTETTVLESSPCILQELTLL